MEDLRKAEFNLVRKALDEAGLPSADFGRFTSNRHADLIRPSVFDYQGSVPVLLELLPNLSHPDVLESVVRSLSTSYARPIAADALITLFVNTAESSSSSLKWAIGNALSTVTTNAYKDELLELALNPRHGTGRQMIVYRLGFISNDTKVVEALRKLSTDSDVALHAQAALRRLLGSAAIIELIQPLLTHSSESVRKAASYNLKKANQALKRKRKMKF
jgi:HEAT repeat protein